MKMQTCSKLMWIAVLTAIVSIAGCASSEKSLRPPKPDAQGRIALFDGKSTDAWEQAADGARYAWFFENGEMRIQRGTGSIQTRELYDDFMLHVEINVPNQPANVTGQRRGNSGVYLQGRYEIQIHDSFGLDPANNLCGAINGRTAPAVNASKPAEQWQTYDIDFTAAKWDAEGNKLSNARVTVRQNDTLIQDDVEIEGPTGAGDLETPEAGPIRLQDHGDNEVRFRNVWVMPK